MSKFREVKSPQFPISLPALALGTEASALLAHESNFTLLLYTKLHCRCCPLKPSYGDFNSQKAV